MRRIPFYALGAALVLFSGACGSDKSTGPGNGGGNGGGNAAFQAEVTGDLEGSISGSATFAQYQDPDLGSVFEINMAEVGGSGQIILGVTGVQPGNGTYAVADIYNGDQLQDGEFFALVVDGSEQNPDAVFFSTGGHVKITSASGSTVKGTFQFDCLGHLNGDPTEYAVTLTGTFTAKSGVPATVTSLRVGRRS